MLGPYPKTCQNCSTSYLAASPNGKFCSVACGKKAWRKRIVAQFGETETSRRRKTLLALGLCPCGQAVSKNRTRCSGCSERTAELRRQAFNRLTPEQQIAFLKRGCEKTKRLYQKAKAAGKKRRRIMTDRDRALHRKWIEANRSRTNATALLWRQKNPERAAMLSQRRRARKRGAEGSHTLEEWLDILKRHDHRCAHCKEKTKLTKDHVIPLSKNGSDYASNLQPLCKPCNSRKGNRLAI